MLIAVRTVAETDDVRTIEGLAYPFKLRDTYLTHFSARTDFHWGLFPDVDPSSATRGDAAPTFVRPVTYHHGFEPDFGLDRIGGWSPVRMDDDGVWVQAQIDKRQRYYATRIKPLLDAGALGLSGGSAEHSVRISASGEVLDWPAYELAMTPVESNPLAQLSVRAGETAGALRIVAARGWLPEGTTQGDLDDGDFAWLATDTTLPDSERRKLPYKIHGTVNADGWKAAWTRAHQAGTVFTGGPSQAEVIKKLLAAKPAGVDVDTAAKAGVRFHSASDVAVGTDLLGGLTALMAREADEPDQFAQLQAAADSLSAWIDAERAEIGQTPGADEADYGSPAFYSGERSAIREGRRNSASDTAALGAAHDNIASVLGMDCAPGDASARSAEDLPVLRLVAEPERPDVALRDLATQAATKAADEAVRRLTG